MSVGQLHAVRHVARFLVVVGLGFSLSPVSAFIPSFSGLEVDVSGGATAPGYAHGGPAGTVTITLGSKATLPLIPNAPAITADALFSHGTTNIASAGRIVVRVRGKQAQIEFCPQPGDCRIYSEPIDLSSTGSLLVHATDRAGNRSMPVRYSLPATLTVLPGIDQQIRIRWTGPPGRFQESRNLVLWQDSSLPVASSQGTNEVVASTVTGSAFFRVER